MGLSKQGTNYKSFDYLEAGKDYKTFEMCDQVERVPHDLIGLNEMEEERVQSLIANNINISMHEHLGVFPKDIMETPAYCKEGRMTTAFEGLANSGWDAVFDNLMDGIAQIHSKSGWKWDDVMTDLGHRLCDIAHQDFIIHCKNVNDIRTAHKEGKMAWIAAMEGAAMIENEVDRVDLLYGFGVRLLGITYSESNDLGSGLKEPRDGGLTMFGRKAVERMNKVGMLIDCSHTGDQTALDTIECSSKPIVLSHIGAKALWESNRLAPDEVIKACAGKGGVIGMEAAPHTTLTYNNRVHTIETVMEHFEYCKDLVGIDHVSFGPDTLYGDHVGLHHAYSAALSLKESKASKPGQEFDEVDYVKGLENPTEGSFNLVRWLVKRNYSDEDIIKVMGGNTLRVLEEVWC